MSSRVLKLAFSLAIASLLGLGSAVPARADQGGTGNASGGPSDPSTVTVHASDSTSSDPFAPGGTSGGSPSPCTYVPLSPADAALLPSGPGGAGSWFNVYCPGPGYPFPLTWVPAGSNPAAVNPVVLAHQAESQLTLPATIIGTAPAANHDQLVHVPTWLWIDPAVWRALSATATAGTVSATATATPSAVVWDTGDAHQIRCAGPGTPYDASRSDSEQHTACGYAWTTSSAQQSGQTYTVTATVYWHVTWTAAGAPGGGDLGMLAGPSARVDVRVAEVQAINGEAH